MRKAPGSDPFYKPSAQRQRRKAIFQHPIEKSLSELAKYLHEAVAE